MARPKSEDKRNAILNAAIRIFAERGVWSTPVAAISKAAGVAEGTLFTYFSTKEVLIDQIYRAIKQELADVLLANFPDAADVREKFWHVWSRYIRWGVANPQKAKVLQQLVASDQISPETRAVGYEPFAKLELSAVESIAQRLLSDYPVAFIATLLDSMAATTMQAVSQNPGSDVDYIAIGFEVLWHGIAA